MTNTIEEITELLIQALTLAQNIDRVKKIEAVLTCHKTQGQEFVIRKQRNEQSNANLLAETPQDIGDHLGSIKKNAWFRKD
jgi:hypothetical protein